MSISSTFFFLQPTYEFHDNLFFLTCDAHSFFIGLMDEFCIVFLWSIDEFHGVFSCEWLVNFWIFPSDLLAKLAIFFHAIDGQILGFFSHDWWKNSIFNVQLTNFANANWLTNFAMLPCDQMLKFMIYFPRSMYVFCEVFLLLPPEKEKNPKGA